VLSGVATLRVEHVTVGRRELSFEYSAKGSIDRSLTVDDPEVLRAVASLCRRRKGSEDLLAWKNKTSWVNVGASGLNEYIKSEAGEQFSAKDFRTWSGTVHAALELARASTPDSSQRARQRAVAGALREVAHFLGNTPAVCRASYVDPRLFDCYEAGETIAEALKNVRGEPDAFQTQCDAEAAVLELLSQGTRSAA
jgi:DNA topoisomerase I